MDRLYPHDGSGDFDKVTLINNFSGGKYKALRSNLECALVHNDGAFERGKDYVIFLNIDETEVESYVPSEFFVVAYLDGEYPRIIFHPYGIEIDATVMGADTKYVSKEVFLQLIYDAVEESMQRSGEIEVDVLPGV